MSNKYGNSYYEYDSLLVLERHLAICSPFGSDARAVGHRIASLSGVAFFDLERRIEHRAGATVAAIRTFDGEEAFDQLRAEALDRLLRDRPFGVLVLASETLANALAVRRLLDETDLVSIRVDFESYLELYLQELGQPEDWQPDSAADAMSDWQALNRATALASHQVSKSANLSSMADSILEAVPALRPS